MLDSLVVEQAVRVMLTNIHVESMRNWHEISEECLLKELVLCVLSSNIKYEVAMSYVDKLDLFNVYARAAKNGVDEDEIFQYLSQPVRINNKDVRYRFPKSKSQQLLSTIRSIYGSGGSLKSLLGKPTSSLVARELIASKCCGVGYKQASMFLRNIGYTYDLAIIDTHIVDYLRLVEVIPSRITINSSSQYLKIEQLYSQYATIKAFDMDKLDVAIWCVMKSYKNYFA